MPSQQARQFRKNPTDAERKLWQFPRFKQLEGHKFRRQCPIGPYIVDFACLQKNLIIEIDGSQHMNDRADAQRAAWLGSVGYRVLRFWDNDVLVQTDSVVEAIVAAIEENNPPSSSFAVLRTGSSPSRGEGTEGSDDSTFPTVHTREHNI